jgi:choline-sulfatase
MTRKLFVVVQFCMWCIWIGASIEPKTQAADRLPNILFLFADDFTYEAIARLGHTDIETPNLDRLALRGTTFTHAYNMGGWNGAICVASRNMLLSGRSLWRAEKVAGKLEQERMAGRLWPQLLQKAGYQTYMTGKWHLQADPERTFDIVRHVRPGMPETVEASYDRPIQGKSDSWSASDPSLGGFWKGGKHWSEVAADDAIEFIQNSQRSSSPFFMYIAFNAPHDPRQSPQAYLDKYPLSRMAMPKSFLPEYPYKDSIGCGVSLRDEKLAPFPRTEFAIQTHRREYYALITHLDHQIGRILDTLDQSGQTENTYLFFTADHGLAVGNHGLVGKQNMYDHSLRVPFIVVGPRVQADRKITAPIYLQDVMPTTLALANVTQPESVEFRSFLPLLRGETDRSRYDTIYGAYLKLQRCIIVDGWKLIHYPKIGVTRLFDQTKDPNEIHDLASDPAQADRKDRMFEKLMALQRELDDPLQ